MLTEVQSRVRKKLHKFLGTPIEEFSADDHLVNTLGMDSLDRVDFVLMIEEEFSITLRDEDIEILQTLGDLEFAVQKVLSDG